MRLELKFVKVTVTERTEFWCQATKRPDKRELCADDVDDDTERDVTHELEASFSFALHLVQGVSRRKKICVQVVAAICRKGEVADPVRGVEGAPHELSPCLDVFAPWNDHIPKNQIGAGLIAMQATLFHQIVAELAEPESGLIVSEMKPRQHA